MQESECIKTRSPQETHHCHCLVDIGIVPVGRGVAVTGVGVITMVTGVGVITMVMGVGAIIVTSGLGVVKVGGVVISRVGVAVTVGAVTVITGS